MAALQNRGVAVLFCAAMILCACTVGAGASLRALRGQAEAVFTTGDIQRDLVRIAEECVNITTVARRYEVPETAVADVLKKRETLASAASPKDKHRAAEELVASAGALVGALRGAGLSNTDNDLAQSCIVEIQSSLARISHSSYNENAGAFNHALGAFPVNIFGGLSGVRPLELYE